MEHYDAHSVRLVVDKSHTAQAEKFLPKLTADLQAMHGEDFQVHLRVGSDDSASTAHRDALLEKAHNTSLARKVREAFPTATLQENTVRAAE